MTESYYSYYSHTYTDRIFGVTHYNHQSTTKNIREYFFPLTDNILSIEASSLHIPSFVIRKWGQVFINPELITINLKQLPADIYRVIAIQNFQIEDCNPRLNECLAGVFLAKQIANRWEEAEDHPIECRSIEVLGYVDTNINRVIDS